MSERDVGPFTVITGSAARRWLPRLGRSEVEDKDGPYHPGGWVSWLGRQVLVCRSKWWLRQATWRNQLTCRIRRHVPVRVVTDAELLGATPEDAEVRVVADRLDCARCGVTTRGPQWVTR